MQANVIHAANLQKHLEILGRQDSPELRAAVDELRTAAAGPAGPQPRSRGRRP